MRHQYVRVRTTIVNVLAAVAIVSVSACTAEPATTALHARLTGEAAFRGLVLGEGDVAKQFPEIWGNLPSDLAPEQEAAQGQARSRLVAEIRKADASFLDRFGAEIQSGDHLRIARVLDESAGVVKRVAALPEFKHDPISTCVAIATVAVALGNIAAAYNVAVYANVVYLLNWFWDGGTADGGGGDTIGGGTIDGGDPGEGLWTGNPLRHDQVVAMIASRLFASAASFE